MAKAAKSRWNGVITAIQPRSKVGRYLTDTRTHSLTGYNLLVKGLVHRTPEQAIVHRRDLGGPTEAHGLPGRRCRSWQGGLSYMKDKEVNERRKAIAVLSNEDHQKYLTVIDDFISRNQQN